MSSTTLNNTDIGNEHSANVTALHFFSPTTARALRAQLKALVMKQEKEKIVLEASLAEIEQDFEAARADNADPLTCYSYCQKFYPQHVRYWQLSRELKDTVRQRNYVRREVAAHHWEMKRRIMAAWRKAVEMKGDLEEMLRMVGVTEDEIKKKDVRQAVPRTALTTRDAEIEARHAQIARDRRELFKRGLPELLNIDG